jgi:peptidyl-tRNA hydrolase, PTH1 family
VWLVGLGNPGPRYAGTRHNVGHDVAHRLVERWKAKTVSRKEAFDAYQARLPGGAGRQVSIVVPLLFMNRSGEALAAYEAALGERVSAEETLVVCDDIYLPVGVIRLRRHGSTGGHNGLQSIQDHFGNAGYARLRIGVGHAGGEKLVDHVLSRFDAADEEAVRASLDRSVEAAETWAREGIRAAMNRFNQRVGEESRDEGVSS